MMELAIYVGLFFAPIAALMGFAISYQEYSRHYSDRRTPLLLALRTALFVFVFFMLLSVGLGFLLPRLAGAPS